jgi:hypothetical protein
MNIYIVTWFNEEYEEYRTEQVDASDIVEACYYVGCKLANVVSATRIYKGND